MRQKFNLWGVIFIFNLVASFTHIAAKEAVLELSPWIIAFYRSILAVAAVWLLMKITGKTVSLEPGDRWRFLTLAALAVPVNQISFIVGIHFTPASHSALLYATTPAWVLLLSILIGLEQLKWWKWAGIGISIVGVFVLMFNELLTFHHSTIGGDFILLIAVLSWSFYTVLCKPIVERYGALETTFLVMAFGAMLYFPFGLTAAIVGDYSMAGTTTWLGILYMGIITSGIAYYLWVWLLERIRPTQVAVIACAQPPTTVILAWLIFGDLPTWNLLLSVILILSGIALMVGYGGPKRGLSTAEQNNVS